MDDDQMTMTMRLPDGSETGPFTTGQLREALRKTKGLREDDPDWKAHNQQAYDVTADELRQFIERAEQLAAEKRDIAEQAKEVFAEAKGRGYDTKVMRKIIALRRRKPDDIAEEEAILDLYKQALGMT